MAWGSGDADFDSRIVTDDNEFEVTDDRAGYTLRRLDLSTEDVREYYYGYSNQVLWPLCHLETDHIVYDNTYWQTYRDVNTRFADLLQPTDDSLVWIHDYHLAILPRLLRETEDTDPTLVHFWHVPWPPVELFETCPQRGQILDGLLANDAVGFHVERYQKRFFECVETLLPAASIDRHDGSIRYQGQVTETYVTPVGIGVRSRGTDPASESAWHNKEAAYDISSSDTLIVGVDRLDYTKGLVERLQALEKLWTAHPEFREELTLVQKVSKSRERIPSYRRYHQRVLERVEEINERFRTSDWRPVVYIDEIFDRETLMGLFASADIGIVSSRRDGLNLTAEELVYASQSDPAVLLLSEFTGVAKLLGDGPVFINPFDTQQFADALLRAIEMSADERQRRHRQMTSILDRHSLDAWLSTHAELFERLSA